MSLVGASRSLLLLGRCAPSVKQNASKIIVKKLELDQNLLMVSQIIIFFLFYINNIVLIFFFLNSIFIKMKFIMLMIQKNDVRQVM